MRRQMLLAAAVLAAFTAAPAASFAQGRRDPEEQARKQQEEAAKKRRQREEWGDVQAPLPQLRNAGPCPFVKSLYDAARYVEFKDGREASSAVGFSGEIQGISAGCSYKDEQPIEVTMEVLFELGKGPQAEGRQKTFKYWVAVTDRNRDVIAKETFDLPVTFPEGEDRVYVTETIASITIPRAGIAVSGSNFEVLVGFDVTPQMAAFNRDGKRFRVNVGQTASAQQTP
ncbi:MAG: Tat pathway signal sequence domain protein [Phenylobacterium sp.]|uniref:Tat pathway signal sequence domain protein n=1 Tax=Phenylobacterium sp. TaxID=1871053 RepID=UPI001A497FD4|nr:Tat pathway signal sequence domain protein [Phenylobacterium sp.]MBL8771063.1 Tat pathway signal sequence domain protein [Phenylobacterium sp.]